LVAIGHYSSLLATTGQLGHFGLVEAWFGY